MESVSTATGTAITKTITKTITETITETSATTAFVHSNGCRPTDTDNYIFGNRDHHDLPSTVQTTCQTTRWTTQPVSFG